MSEENNHEKQGTSHPVNNQMSEDEILRYLRVDAVDDSELGRLIEKIGVRQRR